MKGRLTGQSGMSLVEATIILLVLMLLTGVMAPSITEFVTDAKRVKVKEDCEALGLLTAFWHATENCLQFDASLGCTKSNRVDILFSEGPTILASDLSGDATTAFDPSSLGGVTQTSTLNWNNQGSRGDSFEHQFVTNTPVYSFSSPRTVKPWPPAHAPELQSPVMSDPWGHKYLVNTVFLSTANDADTGTGEGRRSGIWLRKVFCLSAGSNGLFETNFAGTTSTTRKCAVDRGGDDYFYPIGCMNP